MRQNRPLKLRSFSSKVSLLGLVCVYVLSSISNFDINEFCNGFPMALISSTIGAAIGLRDWSRRCEQRSGGGRKATPG